MAVQETDQPQAETSKSHSLRDVLDEINIQSGAVEMDKLQSKPAQLDSSQLQTSDDGSPHTGPLQPLSSTVSEAEKQNDQLPRQPHLPRASSRQTTPEDKLNFRQSLEELLREHELDPNFPQEILQRARNALKGHKANGYVDPEVAQSLMHDIEEHKKLSENNSPYAEVRAIVDPTDDSSLPVGTFRVFLLGTFFTIAGTAIQQFFTLRMPNIGISTAVVQILSQPIGVLLARILPTRRIGFRSWRWSLNPGPFNQKEHILIAMMANVSFGGNSTGAYITKIIQVLTLDQFFGEKILSNSIAWQITTLLATQLIGFGCAGVARRFLVYPSPMIWQRPLANIALTKALFDDGHHRGESVHGWTMSRYRFFHICFCAMFLWFWMPNYLFKALALFNWTTWIAPGSVTLAIITGSTCGLGLNPLPTLDWNIASYLADPIVTPLFTLANFSFGMAVAGFLIGPAMYFSNVWNQGHLPINSNKIFDNTGGRYHLSRILHSNMTFNEEGYKAYSVPWMSTMEVIKITSHFCVYSSIPVYIFLWHRHDVMRSLKAIFARKSRGEQFNDIHNRLMAAYKECPHWWYLIVLVSSFVLACVSVSQWPTGMPIWAVVLAIVFTAILQIPIGILAAISNVEVSTVILSKVIGGYALEGQPVPNMIFNMYTFMSTSQSIGFIQDLKMAHYAKIPPRWAFAAQIYATVLAGFVALWVNNWVLHNVEDLCTENQKDRFTCPHAYSYFLSTVVWGVIGPRRLFGSGGQYETLTYFIPLAIAVPVVCWLLIKRWPDSVWRKLNPPLLFCGATVWAPYNWSYMQGTLALAFFFNFYIKRRYQDWWSRYAYVLSSSFTAGIGVAGLIIFMCLQKWDLEIDWIGNTIGNLGVDRGGFVNDQGERVKCAALPIPERGHFETGF
jgi:OPT family small oligopeptide transporter